MKGVRIAKWPKNNIAGYAAIATSYRTRKNAAVAACPRTPKVTFGSRYYSTSAKPRFM